MTASPHSLFKPRALSHTIILARGETVRHWQIRPGALVAGVAGVLSVLSGCLCATVLFFLSDDVATAFHSREERTVAAYEERISALRQQLDRMTTSQFSDRELVREQIEQLIGQHEALTSRFAQLEPLLDEARSSGLLPDSVPRPSARPDPWAPGSAGEAFLPSAANAFAPQAALPGLKAFDELGVAKADVSSLVDPLSGKTVVAGLDTMDFTTIAEDLIPRLSRSIDEADERQASDIARLTDGARLKVSTIASVLGDAGLALPQPKPEGVGGPFVPAPADGRLDDDLLQLSQALGELQRVNAATERLPLARPLVGGTPSSPFGVRQDPFLKRQALHTGLDLSASEGTPVLATAAGTVVQAGESGGYGRMVEIDHGNGFVTRYAHLSSISAKVGQVIQPQTPIGAVGSTGRSTGSHLHYEVRRGGGAVDPSRFLTTGERLRAL